MAGRKSGHTWRTNRGAKALSFGIQDGLVWLRLCSLLSIESPHCAVVSCQRHHADVCRMQYSMHSALAPAPPSPGQNEHIFIIYRTHTARGAKYISTGTSTMSTESANRKTMQCAIACSAIGKPQFIFFSMHVSSDGADRRCPQKLQRLSDYTRNIGPSVGRPTNRNEFDLTIIFTVSHRDMRWACDGSFRYVWPQWILHFFLH